jgi:hypothetical protein
MRRILIISIAAFILLSGSIFAIQNPDIDFLSTSGKAMEEPADEMTFAKNITGPNKPSVASAEMDNKTSSTSVPQGSAPSQMDKPFID